MAIQTSDALILKRQEFRETSLILTLCTKDFGKIKGIIKGVRGHRTKISDYLQPFTYTQAVFYERTRGELHTISECNTKDPFGGIRGDFWKTVYASYLVELTDELTALGEPNAEIFELLLGCLNALASERYIDRIVRIFEIKLLAASGLMPDVSRCINCDKKIDSNCFFSIKLQGALCNDCKHQDALAVEISKGTIASIIQIQKTGLNMISRIRITEEIRHQLKKILTKFIDFQLGKKLKSVEFIEKVKL